MFSLTVSVLVLVGELRLILVIMILSPLSERISLVLVPCNTLSHRKDFGRVTGSGAVAVHTMEKLLCGSTSMMSTLVGLVATAREGSTMQIYSVRIHACKSFPNGL